MKFFLFVLGACVGIFGAGTRAEAQNYPWCAIYGGGMGGGGTNCGLQHFNNAWTPRAGSVASASRIHNTSPHLVRIRRRSRNGAIHIERLYTELSPIRFRDFWR